MVVNVVSIKTFGRIHNGSEGNRRRMIDAESVVQHGHFGEEVSSLADDVAGFLWNLVRWHEGHHVVDVALGRRGMKSVVQCSKYDFFHFLEVRLIEFTLAQQGEALHGDVLGAEQFGGEEERCDGGKLEGRSITGTEI